MPTIQGKVLIQAPGSKVWAFVTNPENWTKYVTSLQEVSDLSSPSLEPGTRFRWTYRMLGIELKGEGFVTDNQPEHSFGMRMEGTMPVTEHYLFRPDGEQTELEVEIRYELPGKVLEKIASSALAERLNRREAENVLEKIRAFCEAV